MKLRLFLLPLLLVSSLGLSACGHSTHSIEKKSIASSTAKQTTTTLNYVNGNWPICGLGSFILSSPGFGSQIEAGADIQVSVSQVDTNWAYWTYPSSIGAFNMRVWGQFVNGRWYRAPGVDRITGCPYSMGPAVCQGSFAPLTPLPQPPSYSQDIISLHAMCS